MEKNKIYCGHVIDVLRKFPDNSIDVVVTSPPYWNLRDYKIPPSIFGGKIDCKHEWVDEKTWRDNLRFRAGENTQVGNHLNPKIFGDPNMKSSFCLRCGAWRGELGLEPAPQLYVKHLVEIMHEVKRVLKPSGSLFLNLGDGYYGRHGMGNCDADSLGFQKGLYKEFPLNVKYPTEKGGWLQPKQLMGLPERIMIGMQEDGWCLRNKIIWRKGNFMPSSVKDRLTNSYEFVYFFVKNNEPLWYYNTKTGATTDRHPEMSVEGVDYYLKGKRKISFWHGFRYFFDLDAIRVPAKTAHKMLEQKTKPFGKRGSPRYRNAPVGESYGVKSDEAFQTVMKAYEKITDVEVQEWKGKSASLDAQHSFRRLALNERKSRIKFEWALDKCGVQGEVRRQMIAYWHDHSTHPRGKNPGDIFQSKKEPYLQNNPHIMRLKKDQYLALNPDKPSDLSHPLGKNPGDVWNRKEELIDKLHEIVKQIRGESTYEGKSKDLAGWNEAVTLAKAYREALKILKTQLKLTTEEMSWLQDYVQNHLGHPLGRNPGDIFTTKHDEAVKRGGNVSYIDPLHTKAYNPAGKDPGDFWMINTKPFRGAHFACFPPALVEQILKCACPREVCPKCGKPRTKISGLTKWTDCGCGEKFEGGTVLDIFLGSGTTAVVAKKMGLDFVGIEIKKEYCEIARNRLRKEFPTENFDQLVIYEKELNIPRKQDHAVTI